MKIWVQESSIQELRDVSRGGIHIINGDPLEAAYSSGKEKLRTLVVVENDGIDPTGALEKGWASHSIYLRSNLCNCFKNNDKLINLRRGEVLLACNVSIYKDSTYRQVKPVLVDIALASPKKIPILVSENSVDVYGNLSDYTYMRDLIEKIFQLGQEYDFLVMGDFGCSYINGNPINVIVDIINDMRSEYPIPIVVFCVGENSIIIRDRDSEARYAYFKRNIIKI